MRGERRQLGGRGHRRPAHQIVELLQAERSEQASEERRAFAAAVLRPRGDIQGATPQPVAATFIAELPPVPAGPVQLAPWVARVTNRAAPPPPHPPYPL